jgi:type II secretory pathway pseudopilin PulG
VADDKVALVRQDRAQQAQKQQQMAAAQQAASTAKDLAQTPTDGNTALSQVAGQFSGYSVPGTL